MNPTQYVERVPVFTAVQWDGSEESATWIAANYPGAERRDDTIVVRDSLDRETVLDTGTWVILDAASGQVVTEPDATFSVHFRLADE